MKKLIPFAALGLLVAGATGCGGVTPWEGDWNWDDAIADGELGYIVCIGEDGNPEAIDRTQGCKDALDEIATKGGFKAKLLEEHICVDNAGSWSDTAAADFVTRAVTQYGNKLDFIVSNNDGMAVAASKVNGLAKKTPIIGFDALSSACTMIKEGTLAGSVSQNGDDQALIVATMLGNMALGNEDVVTEDYGGRAKINLTNLDDHLVSTALTAVTASNADEMKPGNYVTVEKMTGLDAKRLLVVEYNATDNFIQETYHKALPHYAQALGFTCETSDIIQGDGTNDTSLQDSMKTALSKTTYDAVALNVITHTNYQAYIDSIHAVNPNMPIVFFNRQPMKDKTNTADISGLNNVYFVGSSSTGQGAAQGQIILDWYEAISK